MKAGVGRHQMGLPRAMGARWSTGRNTTTARGDTSSAQSYPFARVWKELLSKISPQRSSITVLFAIRSAVTPCEWLLPPLLSQILSLFFSLSLFSSTSLKISHRSLITDAFTEEHLRDLMPFWCLLNQASY